MHWQGGGEIIDYIENICCIKLWLSKTLSSFSSFKCLYSFLHLSIFYLSSFSFTFYFNETFFFFSIYFLVSSSFISLNVCLSLPSLYLSSFAYFSPEIQACNLHSILKESHYCVLPLKITFQSVLGSVSSFSSPCILNKPLEGKHQF